MKTFAIIFVSVLLLLSIRAYSQIEIEMNSGKKYCGIISNDSNDSISIRTTANLIIVLPKNQIEKIEALYSDIKLQNGISYKGHILKKTDSIITVRSLRGVIYTLQKNEISVLNQHSTYQDSSFLLLGITIFNPGRINILGGYHFGIFGFRAEFGGNDIGWGTQANFLLNAYQSKYLEVNFSLCAGYTSFRDEEWGFYGGPCVDINAGGIFLESGFGFFSSASDFYEGLNTPKFIFQIGFVYRFN